MQIAGKVAIVTGGASGLGRATATALAQAGAKVAIWDMNEELGNEVVAELGENTYFTKINVTDTAAVEAFDASFPPMEKKWMPSQEEFYIYRHSSVVR